VSTTSDLNPIYRRTFTWIRGHPDPVITAGELAEWSGLTQQGANRRLNHLEECGVIQSKKTGGAAKVYWPSDS